MKHFRRITAAFVAAAALGLAGSAVSAAATPATAAVRAYPGPYGDQPIQFGPFQFPSQGAIGGGFSWTTGN